MQFKLGPFTITKGSCFVCTNMIPGGDMAGTSPWKREARVCERHGSGGYPHTFQCAICKMQRPVPKGPAAAFEAPIPLIICLECWYAGAGGTRCCGLD
jgi:hypothetical protein